MITANRLDEKTITGSINGKPFSVTYNEERYRLMTELVQKSAKVSTMDEMKSIIDEFKPYTEESYKEMIESASPHLFVNPATNSYHLKINGKHSAEKVPQVLVDKMIESAEKNIDITPLVKCWVRFLRNPNYSKAKAKKFAQYLLAPYTDQKAVDKLMDEQGLSRKVAAEKATTPQVAITVEGLIVGYKVSTEIMDKYALDDEENVVKKSRYTPSIDEDTGVVTYDEPKFAEERLFEPRIMGQTGDSFRRVGGNIDKDGHHISVGCVHFLDDWSKVDCDDDRSGAKGLHVGGLNYIHGYQNDGSVTHNVLIDPADIGAIVGLGYGNDGAMRGLRYFVYSTMSSVNKNIYHGSTYAAMGDKLYTERLAEVVAATEAKKTEAELELENAKNLIGDGTIDIEEATKSDDTQEGAE